LATLFNPVLVPFLIGTRFDEEFHLHWFELTGTENEVARRDLIAEGLSDLTDAERRALTRGGHNVLEVHENALCCFGAQVVQA
jgi:hypothetical protein